MSRWKAAGIHLLISAVIGAVVGFLLFVVWYPPPYFHAAGADELVLLLVGVDLCLGPLLTLIVFRSGKRGLAFDLSFIALAQSAALVYGLAVILESRPVFLVGVLDRFVLVSANQIQDADLAKGPDARFRSRSWTGPRLVSVEIPTDTKERNDLLFAGFAGRDIQFQPMYYRDYDRFGTALLARAQPLATLEARSPDARGQLDTWLEQTRRQTSSVVWLPLQARKADIVMLLDARTAEPLRALDIAPP